MSCTHSAAVLPLFAVALLSASDSLAQRAVTWTGLMDNFWDVNANWIDDEAPPQMLQPFLGDNAHILALGAPTVRFLEQFDNLTNAGTIQVNSTMEMRGDSVDNDGVINIGDGSDIISQMLFTNPFTNELNPMLTGSGEIVLQKSPGAGGITARVGGGHFAEDPVTHAAAHTIRGEGGIVGNWINEGLIRAEETTGDLSATLILDSATIENRGEIRSSPTARLIMQGGTLTGGPGGQVISDTMPIELTSGTVIGATLNATGGGRYEVTDGNGGPVLSGVTLNAPLDNTNAVGNSFIRSDAGGLTNSSTITLDGQGNAISQFGFVTSGALDGTGDIVLQGGDNNTLIGVFPGVSAEFTQGANHSIRGAGLLGSPMINNGTIRAEPGTNGSSLDIRGLITNNGRMEAGAGAILNFHQTAPVTQSATGVIAAADGGTVELGAARITGGSLDTAGSGQITVTINAPVLTDVTNLGTLNVPGGRTVSFAGQSLTNDGTITLNNDNANAISQLTYPSDLALDGTGEIVLNSPTNQPALLLSAGGVHTLTHGADHTIRGAGILRGIIVNHGRIEGNSTAEPLTINADLSGAGPVENVVINQVHSPGAPSVNNGTAIVPLEGSYEIGNFNASLEIELGGTTPGAGHDQLSSTGTVDLAGMLDVELIGGFVPTGGDRFTIIDAPNNPIAGTFDIENLPANIANFAIQWEPLEYNANDVTLEVASVTALPGDYNADGVVDAADFTVWRDTLGDSGLDAFAGADGDGDGEVTVADYTVWRTNFGATAPGAVAAPAPEPSTTVLWLFALYCLLAPRRVSGAGRDS